MLRRTRRAPTACSWCHHRKVRCDASILGCPCTRCRQDGRDDCTLRRKLPKSQTLGSSPGPTSRGAQFHATNLPGPTISSNNSSSLEKSLKVNCLSESLGLSSVAIPEDSVENDDSLANLEGHPFLDIGNLKHLPSEDIAFLCAKGALSIPEHCLIEESLCHYFKQVHPMLPIIDEAFFWRAICEESGDKVSLFVFQAMLFVSCSFVSLRTLRKSGFTDRRDARTRLYNRAKLLFDLKAEMMPFAKAQGAIILTHHTSAESPLSGSLWLTCAIQNAMMIDGQPHPFLGSTANVMKKRLWWSILLRDRSLCIGLRRCPQVTSINLHECCDWLTEEDFADEMHKSRFYDYQSKKLLLFALQEQCQLATLLTELATVIFSPRVTPASTYNKEEFGNLMDKLRNIKKSLINWESQSQPAPGLVSAPQTDPSVPLRSLTFMYYYTASVDLAHYSTLLIEEYSALPSHVHRDIMASIANDLKSGVDGLNIVMEHFSTHGHVDNVPLSVLGYVGMPLVLAAVNLKLSPSREETESRQKVLASLSNIIRHSETLYDVTDSVAAGTNQILQLAYATTKNIFLSNEPARGSSGVHGTGTRSTCGRMSSSQISNRSKSLSFPRATNWLEAFSRCPRAYLLISTCVDHSLSVGCLPYIGSLPTLVHEIPTMFSMVHLPWIVQSNCLELSHRVNQSPPPRSEFLDTERTSEELQSDSDNLNQKLGHTLNGWTAAQRPAETVVPANLIGNRLVNLDFLDFDSDFNQISISNTDSSNPMHYSSFDDPSDINQASFDRLPFAQTLNEHTVDRDNLHPISFQWVGHNLLEDQALI
ncbi:hypothetical protein N7456_002779 [Penicillium angulare]|uniref:Zn(2)-C6 fungal-type domain-containing protein n=1 Tax=Penicillium angulare TaxID=116970 RepID=A0A9W9FTJ3_9EURO|nr:hypothetical protein N7456_002779 [Penicillium angulare]